MLALLLALALPILQAAPTGRPLSTRWHPTVAIETGLTNLAFIDICPSMTMSAARIMAADSAGNIVEMAFVDRKWTIVGRATVGEPIVSGCAAAMRPDEVWSLIIGTKAGNVYEMRRSELGWGRHEVTTLPGPLRTVAATEPARPGPSQVFVIDANGEVTNWYVGASGRWNRKTVPPTDGGATHICFDYSKAGLQAITAGPKGLIYRFIQDTMGDWSGDIWNRMSAGCLDLAASADPSMQDICLFYSGTDGHLRYLFSGRMDDVTSRLESAQGAYHLIGKGDQRRFNEFFGMSGSEFCLFEYESGLLDWAKIPIRDIPSPVVSTVFGLARGGTWHTMYAATVDGKIYEFERDGLENE